MINIDLILIFLTLLIFFYTVEMICNYIVITRKKEKDNTIEGFDLDDITDSPLSMILIFVSSAAVGYLIYKYFKGKKKSEIQQSIDLEKIKTDASVAEAKIASSKSIELEKFKMKEKKEAEDKAAAEKKTVEDKAVAEKKASEDKAAAEKKTAEDKAAAEKKTAEDKAAAEKKAAEDKAAAAASTEAATPTNNQEGGEVGALNAISRFVQMLI